MPNVLILSKEKDKSASLSLSVGLLCASEKLGLWDKTSWSDTYFKERSEDASET